MQRFNVLAHNVFASSRARHRKSRLAETEQSSALLSEGTFLEEAHVTVSETGRAIDVVVQAPEVLDRAQRMNILVVVCPILLHFLTRVAHVDLGVK